MPMQLARCLPMSFLLSISVAGPATVAPPKVRQPACPVVWDGPAVFRGVNIRDQRKGFPDKKIALTFDDGPSTTVTPLILAALRKEGVHATFFHIGMFSAAHPDLVKQEIAEGHAIGIHTYTHSMHPTRAQAASEITRCQSVLEKTQGKRTNLFRAPYGRTHSAYNVEALRRGFIDILWTNSGADTATKDWTVVRDNIVENAKPGDIVLMHDALGKNQTAQAVPEIIARLKKKGFTFLTVPEMLIAWDAASQARLHARRDAKKLAPHRG